MRYAPALLAVGWLSLASAHADETATIPTDLLEKLKAFQANEETIGKNLATFDTLDFDVYSNQKWERLGESHAEDIVVHYPDGTTTTGIKDHIERLKPLFVFAPDTRIKEHPIRFGSGAWTGVVGSMEGTFTQPMPVDGGTAIAPTGKAFKLGMATIGKWNDKGVMSEEYLFWDNAALMTQLGLSQ